MDRVRLFTFRSVTSTWPLRLRSAEEIGQIPPNEFLLLVQVVLAGNRKKHIIVRRFVREMFAEIAPAPRTDREFHAGRTRFMNGQ